MMKQKRQNPANTGHKRNILKSFCLVCRVFLPFKKRFYNVRCLLGRLKNAKKGEKEEEKK